MAFIRIWVSTTWIWCCEGFICQFLAKKGEKGFAQMVDLESALPDVLQRCRRGCLSLRMVVKSLWLVSWVMNTVVTCVLSYQGWWLICQGRLGASDQIMSAEISYATIGLLWQKIPGLRGSVSYLLPRVHQMTSGLSTPYVLMCCLKLLSCGAWKWRSFRML